MAGLTRLQALDVEQWSHPLPSTRWLPSGLQQLRLMAAHLPEPLVSRHVAALVQLTGLELSSQAGPLPPLLALTALRRLRERDAGEAAGSDAGLQLLPPLAFPDLQCLEMRGRALRIRVRLAATQRGLGEARSALLLSATGACTCSSSFREPNRSFPCKHCPHPK